MLCLAPKTQAERNYVRQTVDPRRRIRHRAFHRQYGADERLCAHVTRLPASVFRQHCVAKRDAVRVDGSQRGKTICRTMLIAEIGACGSGNGRGGRVCQTRVRHGVGARPGPYMPRGQAPRSGWAASAARQREKFAACHTMWTPRSQPRAQASSRPKFTLPPADRIRLNFRCEKKGAERSGLLVHTALNYLAYRCTSWHSPAPSRQHTPT